MRAQNQSESRVFCLVLCWLACLEIFLNVCLSEFLSAHNLSHECS